MTNHHVPEITSQYVHLKSTVSRSEVVDGVLRSHAMITVDLASAKQPVGVAVVVHWTEQIPTCTLADAVVPHDAQRVLVRVTRAAKLAEVDVYGFPSIAAYLLWLIWIPQGNPPKTAGDGMNAPPVVTP